MATASKVPAFKPRIKKTAEGWKVVLWRGMPDAWVRMANIHCDRWNAMAKHKEATRHD